MIRSRHHRWNPPTLSGNRLQLRPLNDDDFSSWSEVRLRNADWLLRWEPLRPEYAPDPAVERSAFVNRCRARERETAADQAYPFGIFVSGQLVGEINLNNVVRGALNRGRSDIGSTKRTQKLVHVRSSRGHAEFRVRST